MRLSYTGIYLWLSVLRHTAHLNSVRRSSSGAASCDTSTVLNGVSLHADPVAHTRR